MKKCNRPRLPVIAALLLAFLSAAPHTLAQKESGEKKGNQLSERRKIRVNNVRPQTTNVEDGREQVKGERGVSTRAAVINFAALSRREALKPNVPRKPKDVDGPEPDYDNLPLPSGVINNGKEGASAAEAASNNPVRGGELGGPLSPSPVPLSSFPALADGLFSIPPDTHGAVGPNHLMTTLNTHVRIQDRNGLIISTVTLDSFWASLGNPDSFDPQILYDPYAGRWIITASADGDAASSSVLLGASQTSDPTGNWNLYRVDVDSLNQLWADYPRLGFNKDWIVVQVNMFPTESSPTTAPRTNIYVFNKSSVLGGATASFTKFSELADGSSSSYGQTQVPALTYDPARAGMYLVNRWSSSLGLLRLFTITGPIGGETLTRTNILPGGPPAWASSSGGVGDFGAQAGSYQRINVGDSRVQQAVFRNGSLWCVHTIFLPASGASRAAIQWWQIEPSSGVVQQRGLIDDPNGTTSYAYPSIAVNKNNDVLIGYSRFSGTQFVSANYSFRAGTDPLNTMRADTILKDGEGPYYKTFERADSEIIRNRWGDYSNTAVDPLNDTDMWTLQEYAMAPVASCSANCGRWGTWWGRVTADGTQPGPAPAATPTPTPLPTPANDAFSNAQQIDGCAGSTDGTNLGATKEAGEPNHRTVSPVSDVDKSVWYRWQAPGNGSVTFTTKGGSFDTLLAVYTGAQVNALSLVVQNDDNSPDLTSSVTFNASAGTVYRIAVDGFNLKVNGASVGSESGYFPLNWSFNACPAAPSPVFQFSQRTYNVLEGAHYALITVLRNGSAASAATASFQTLDANAEQRTDYTSAFGTLNFAAGETSKTFPVVIADDAYVEANELIQLSVSDITGGTINGAPSSSSIRIIENDTTTATTNPIDDARFFVRQNYADFLNREPDAGGLDYWTNQITQCGSNVNCVNFWRSAVSAAFFIELEFQNTGSFVYRIYKASFGTRPAYAQFTPDRARLVDSPNLEQNKQSFVLNFVQRPEFVNRYSGLDRAAFVDAMLQTVQQSSQVDLTSQRTALINAYDSAGGGQPGRAAVLRAIADNSAFVQAEYNKAFVLMQYFGFLKRDPDEGGYQFWLGVVNNSVPNDPSGYRSMVCAFITSREYQERFSGVITRNDSICAPQ